MNFSILIDHMIGHIPRPFIICGQTATGKTALSLELSYYLKQKNKNSSTIISADSRQIYCGLDTASNKITQVQMKNIPHYGLDIAKPETRYTVYDFQQYARHKISETLSENSTPVICGGTGLYIDATVFNEFDFDPNKKGSIKYSDATYWQPSENQAQLNYIWIGLWAPREWLGIRINQLAIQKRGAVIEEIKILLSRGVSRDWIYRLGLEPKYAIQVIESTISPDQYVELLVRDTLQYTKRQMTWFKRNPHIQWFDVSKQSNTEILNQIFSLDIFQASRAV